MNVETGSSTQGTDGHPTPTWSNHLASYPARIDAGSPGGKESKRFESIEATAGYKVTMRRDLTVTQEMRVKVVSSRVVAADTILHITGIARPEDAPDWMILSCTERT